MSLENGVNFRLSHVKVHGKKGKESEKRSEGRKVEGGTSHVHFLAHEFHLKFHLFI